MFRKSDWSQKGTVCSRLAQHIEGAAIAMGLEAATDRSAISASHYVYVSLPDSEHLELDPLKIRVSDHDDKHGGSSWYVWAGQCPSEIITRMAAYFEKQVPEKYLSENYDKRSEQAVLAAGTRRANHIRIEEIMLAETIAALRESNASGLIAAGKQIDKLFPQIPRAQRQRIAHKASAALVERTYYKSESMTAAKVREINREAKEDNMLLEILVSVRELNELNKSAVNYVVSRRFQKISQKACDRLSERALQIVTEERNLSAYKAVITPFKEQIETLMAHEGVDKVLEVAISDEQYRRLPYAIAARDALYRLLPEIEYFSLRPAGFDKATWRLPKDFKENNYDSF